MTISQAAGKSLSQKKSTNKHQIFSSITKTQTKPMNRNMQHTNAVNARKAAKSEQSRNGRKKMRTNATDEKEFFNS